MNDLKSHKTNLLVKQKNYKFQIFGKIQILRLEALPVEFVEPVIYLSC